MVHPFVLPLVFVLGIAVGLWLERKAARRARALERLYDRRGQTNPIPQPTPERARE
jgi:cytochrome c oxidase assembly factor CtaG